MEKQTTPRAPWAGLWVLAIGLGMIIMDGTIVSVSMPVIIKHLGIDLTDAQWVTALYNIIFAALLLPFGRYGDRHGRKKIFLIGTGVFIAGSLAAALSPSGSWLLAARAFQGVGGAMILPATLSTVSATFRGKDRAAAFGIWGAVMSGAAALGPFLGGVLTTYDWRWIFLINLPIGILVILFGLRLVPESTIENDGAAGSDLVGSLLAMFGSAAVVFGLIEGQDLGWLKPIAPLAIARHVLYPKTMAISIVPLAIVLGLIALVSFVLWEQRREDRGQAVLLNISLFKIKTFAWGNLTATVVAAGEFALMFILPLYMADAMGLSLIKTGAIIGTMALGAFFSGAMARHLAQMIGAGGTVLVGLGLEIIGSVVTILLMHPTLNPWLFGIGLLVYGIGLGLASAQLTSVVLAKVPVAQSGAASATQSTVRQLGSALGSAIAGTSLSTALLHAMPHHLTTISQLPRPVVHPLVMATKDSAGGMIETMRTNAHVLMGMIAEHAPASLHSATLMMGNGLIKLNHQVVTALANGFAEGSQWAIGIAVVMMVIGLGGALVVYRALKEG